MATATLYRRINLTPEAFALLSRPVVGQGGYQDRLRRLQAALGVEPSEAMNAISPSRATIPVSYRPEPAERRAERRQIAPRSADISDKLTMLETVIADLMTQIEGLKAGTTAATETDDDQDDDDAINVADLDAVLRKAQKVRQQKAALHAVGRKRRSPKLTDTEREKRSKRMKAFWRKARKATK